MRRQREPGEERKRDRERHGANGGARVDPQPRQEEEKGTSIMEDRTISGSKGRY
jgi:hypothetical protein